jgi:sucrose-6-phosphate hydrolase SacC (GH32 family)
LLFILPGVNNVYAGALPTYPWRCSFSFPRELTLHNDTDMNGNHYLRLHSTPVKELEMYHQHIYSLNEPVYVTSTESPEKQNLFATNLKFSGSRVCEVNAVFSIPQKPLAGNLEFGFYFRADANRSNYTTVGFNLTYPLTNPSVYLDRRNSGFVTFAKNFATINYNEFPFTYDPSGANYTLDIKILLDTSSIELFVQDGAITASYLIFPYDEPVNDEVVLWVKSGGVLVNTLNVIDYAPATSSSISNPMLTLEEKRLDQEAKSILHSLSVV